MNRNTLDLLEKRRSVYHLGKNVSLSKDEIIDLIESVIYRLPSAFNCQSTRVAIFFGEEHDKLWDLTEEKERNIPKSEEALNKFNTRLALFRKSLGTVLFFEDQNVLEQTSKEKNVNEERVSQWSHEHQGASTVAVWTALAENDIGANLQHYIFNIRDAVHEVWDIPKHWKLYAQLIFGSIEEPGIVKEKVDICKRVKVFG
jgi:predicted oxidoreductase (fatty acid repression mutant protein)